MGVGFGLGNQAVNRQRVFPDLLGDGQMRQQMLDIRHARMAVRMAVFVRVAVLVPMAMAMFPLVPMAMLMLFVMVMAMAAMLAALLAAMAMPMLPAVMMAAFAVCVFAIVRMAMPVAFLIVAVALSQVPAVRVAVDAPILMRVAAALMAALVFLAVMMAVRVLLGMRVAASFAVFMLVCTVAMAVFFAVVMPASALLMAMQMLRNFRLLPCRGGQLEILVLSLHGLAAALLRMGMAVRVSAISMVMTVAPTVAMAALCKRIAVLVRFFTVVAVPALCVGVVVSLFVGMALPMMLMMTVLAVPVAVKVFILLMPAASARSVLPVLLAMAVSMLLPFAVGMAMPMGQVVAVLLLPADAHVHMRPPNAALLRRGCRDLQARDAQRIHIPQKLLPGPRLQQLVKRGHEHIPRRAHIALQIQRFHLIPSIWLMRLAKKPAPNPLSILTTLHPLAQELSMESRAESPPKFAP